MGISVGWCLRPSNASCEGAELVGPPTAHGYSRCAGGSCPSPVPPLLLVFWGVLGQVLFPLDFNQLVQLHGGLGVFYRGMSTLPDLDGAGREEREATRDCVPPSRRLPGPCAAAAAVSGLKAGLRLL